MCIPLEQGNINTPTEDILGTQKFGRNPLNHLVLVEKGCTLMYYFRIYFDINGTLAALDSTLVHAYTFCKSQRPFSLRFDDWQIDTIFLDILASIFDLPSRCKSTEYVQYFQEQFGKNRIYNCYKCFT